MAAVLEVTNLTKTYSGAAVLENIGFTLRESEILGLIGPNGSGKTTLMESVAGILASDTGLVSWNGRALPYWERKNILFYVPEAVLPYPDQRVGEVLHFFTKIFSSEPSHTDLVLGSLALHSVHEKRVKTLSKGYHRRLLIALALLSPKPILFLDEPFDGLDLKQTMSVMELLKEIRLRGKTLFLAIHQLHDAARICDRFLLLSSGKVLGEGTLGELRERANVNNGTLEEIFLALT